MPSLLSCTHEANCHFDREKLNNIACPSHSFSLLTTCTPVFENICYPAVNTGSSVDILQLPSRLSSSTT